MNRRGFTLLEVMVAVTILGLGLTMILSSQAGLLGSTWRIRYQAHADTLVRCKMAEIEEKLLRDGYPLTDQNDDGECCVDADLDDFSCSWKIEKVELPQPTAFAESDGTTSTDDGKSGGSGGSRSSSPKSDGSASDGSSASAFGNSFGSGALPSEFGSFSKFQSLGTTGGTGLPSGGKTSDLMSTLSSGGGTQGIVSMMMGLVYPMLKPMLEASIRRVAVTVTWKESGGEKSFTVVQFVTNPTQGGLANDQQVQSIQALTGAGPGATTGATGTTGTGTTGTGTTGTGTTGATR